MKIGNEDKKRVWEYEGKDTTEIVTCDWARAVMLYAMTKKDNASPTK